jgi:hypothetical protein
MPLSRVGIAVNYCADTRIATLLPTLNKASAYAAVKVAAR